MDRYGESRIFDYRFVRSFLAALHNLETILVKREYEV